MGVRGGQRDTTKRTSENVQQLKNVNQTTSRRILFCRYEGFCSYQKVVYLLCLKPLEQVSQSPISSSFSPLSLWLHFPFPVVCRSLSPNYSCKGLGNENTFGKT